MTDTRVLYEPKKELWETLSGDLGLTHNLNLGGFIEGVVLEGSEGILAHALPTRLSKLQRFEIGQVDLAQSWIEFEVRAFYTELLARLLGNRFHGSGDSGGGMLGDSL